MPILNDRDRHLLHDLERKLQAGRPRLDAPIQGFRGTTQDTPRRPTTGDGQGLLVVLAALCLLLGIPVGAVIFGSAVIVLAYIRYRR